MEAQSLRTTTATSTPIPGIESGFVDTSAWCALVDSGLPPAHAVAAEAVKANKGKLVTSDYVSDEIAPTSA